MNAEKIVHDADYALDHNIINLGKYESLVSVTRDVIPRSQIDKLLLEISMWYYNTDIQELAKDPKAIDSLLDMVVKTIHKYTDKENEDNV